MLHRVTQEELDQTNEGFAQLVRALNDSIAKAARINEGELVERLAAAKGAAERGWELFRRLRDSIHTDTDGKTPST